LDNSSSSSSNLSLIDLLTQTTQSMEQSMDFLQKKRPATLPVFFYDSMTHLSTSLKQLDRAVRDMDEERQKLSALAGIGDVVNSSLRLETVLEIAMDTIIRLTNAERGFLMLRGDSGEMEIQVARNWDQTTVATSDFSISSTIVKQVAEQQTPVLTTNAQSDPRFDGQQSVMVNQLRSILCVPLEIKSSLLGVIYVDNRIRSGIFSKMDLELLTAFANQAAVAIENARLFRSISLTLEEVTELKNLMDNVLASIASGVITADVEDKIILTNRAAESILGRAGRELVGHPLLEEVPPLADALQPMIDRVLQTNQPVIGMETSPELPSRGVVDLRFNLSPLKDAQQRTQGVAIVVDDLTEKKRLERQRRLFERMVSPAVIDQLDPDRLELGGSRAEITVLFADIRGFTSFAEQLDPVELVTVLNQYLATAADAVLQQEGTIDKFMGDAVMAWFNAPIAQIDHPMRAIRAALVMQSRIKALHDRLPETQHLSFGVGIHTGEAVLGLVGTEKRLEYTAMGDCVNTTKRLQENAVSGQILISAQTYTLVQRNVVVRAVEPMLVKGKRAPLEVYEVLATR
jgi:PAS domain S-box-containing protein